MAKKESLFLPSNNAVRALIWMSGSCYAVMSEGAHCVIALNPL